MQACFIIKEDLGNNKEITLTPSKIIEIDQQPESVYGVSKFLTPNKGVVFEGELYKLTPKCNNLIINRFCQVKDGVFKYYKNQIHANTWLSKPIFQIHLTVVSDVKM